MQLLVCFVQNNYLHTTITVMEKSDNHIFKYNFGIAEIHDNYMIMKMNEGITVNSEINKILTDLAIDMFEGRPFGYITRRENSYSVDPNVYLETSKIENLVGFAIVSKEKIHITTVEVEKLFLNKPMKVFEELKGAIAWVQSIIIESNK